jgi:hypothetical protein
MKYLKNWAFLTIISAMTTGILGVMGASIVGHAKLIF